MGSPVGRLRALWHSPARSKVRKFAQTQPRHPSHRLLRASRLLGLGHSGPWLGWRRARSLSLHSQPSCVQWSVAPGFVGNPLCNLAIQNQRGKAAGSLKLHHARHSRAEYPGLVGTGTAASAGHSASLLLQLVEHMGQLVSGNRACWVWLCYRKFTQQAAIALGPVAAL